MKEHPRSALVDLVMPEASEEERKEAARHWFAFLAVLARIVDDEERRITDSQESARDDRFRR